MEENQKHLNEQSRMHRMEWATFQFFFEASASPTQSDLYMTLPTVGQVPTPCGARHVAKDRWDVAAGYRDRRGHPDHSMLMLPMTTTTAPGCWQDARILAHPRCMLGNQLLNRCCRSAGRARSGTPTGGRIAGPFAE